MEEQPMNQGEETQKAAVFNQYFASLSATLAAFALGNVLGWSAPASEGLKTSYNMSEDQIGWISSIMCLGAAAVMLPLSVIIDRFGRKLIMLVLVLPFVGGWLMMAFVKTFPLFCVARIITGFCGGAFCVVVPIFIGEISQPHIRGQLGVGFQLLLVVGILFAYSVGCVDSIMILSLSSMICVIIFGIIFLFIPESPHFYYLIAKPAKAAQSFQWFRGKHFDIATELKDIETFIEQTHGQQLTLKQKFSSIAAVRSLNIGLGLMIVQQFSGINAVIFHMTEMFQHSGTSLEPKHCTIIVGVVQVLATLLAALTVEKAGRKILLIVSLISMGVCHIALGIYFTFYLKDKTSVDGITWLPVVILCLFIIAFSLGAGPVPWLMMGELFPMEIKSIASSMCGFLNWTSAFVVPLMYKSLQQKVMTDNYIFWLFGIICFLSSGFIFFVCVETKGKTLEQIQIILEEK